MEALHATFIQLQNTPMKKRREWLWLEHVGATVVYCSPVRQRTHFIFLTLWHPAAYGDFRKKSLNACGFAQEFLRSGMLYRPGKSLKRCGKYSSLHSKKIFCLGMRVFC